MANLEKVKLEMGEKWKRRNWKPSKLENVKLKMEEKMKTNELQILDRYINFIYFL